MNTEGWGAEKQKYTYTFPNLSITLMSRIADVYRSNTQQLWGK